MKDESLADMMKAYIEAKRAKTSKRCYVCGIEKSFDDFPSSRNRADGVGSKCKSCMKVYSDSHYMKNAEKRRSQMKLRYQENKQYYHEKSAKWKKDNPERNAEWLRNWQTLNPDKVSAFSSKRRAARLKATPKWAHEKAMRQYYLIASFLTLELGAEFHVDHVVPLQSDLVCGLHCEANLSLMLGSWNMSKGNRSWPDMPE